MPTAKDVAAISPGQNISAVHAVQVVITVFSLQCVSAPVAINFIVTVTAFKAVIGAIVNPAI